MFEAVEALTKKYEEMQAQLSAEGQAAVKLMFRDFFAAHPSVAAVRWTQYTPHFNDGDPCTFSVREADLRLQDGDDWLTSWDLSKHANGRLTRLLQGRTEKDLDSLEDDFVKLSDLLQSDSLLGILKITFGDGYEVTATREAITAEHYDRD